MTVWSKHRSCVERCWFFWFTLSSSLCRPICHFAAFDSGKVDLVALLERICISDCKWLDKGIFLYVIRHLCKFCPSSFALWIGSLISGCISQLGHLIEGSEVSLWYDWLDTLPSALWKFHWCSMVCCLILMCQATHIQQIFVWCGRLCREWSLTSVFSWQGISLCNLQVGDMSFPQSGIGGMLLMSKETLELLGLMQSMCLVSF